ncbi:MAG: SGNH/GDSL hydrolase family protein [Clostridia bacterium]|nr:SGNH/GDSL hydrolase family protein [Clostridia bacterium]
MSRKKTLRILFVGNSHTYYNDMPHLVQLRAEKEGFACQVTMIAHGGWYLSQHAEEPDVRFNIAYGGYDYVVLQEHAHPFGPEERFAEAVKKLNAMIRAAGAVPVIYACWAREGEREKQALMNEVHERTADAIDALLAPVGEKWWDAVQRLPEHAMYAQDGAHASPAGSDFAAEILWQTIRDDMERREERDL